jgi:hypothetical protein
MIVCGLRIFDSPTQRGRVALARSGVVYVWRDLLMVIFLAITQPLTGICGKSQHAKNLSPVGFLHASTHVAAMIHVTDMYTRTGQRCCVPSVNIAHMSMDAIPTATVTPDWVRPHESALEETNMYKSARIDTVKI